MRACGGAEAVATPRELRAFGLWKAQERTHWCGVWGGCRSTSPVYPGRRWHPHLRAISWPLRNKDSRQAAAEASWVLGEGLALPG